MEGKKAAGLAGFIGIQQGRLEDLQKITWFAKSNDANGIC